MRKILVACIMALVIYLSWDNRQTKSESLENAVLRYNTERAELTMTKIIPEEVSFTKVDSILSNGFRVKIANFSTDDKSDLITVNNEATDKTIIFHRKFQSQIEIAFQNKPILNLSLNAKSFKLKTKDQFWNSATLQHAWLDQEQSTSETVSLKFSFVNPVSNYSKLYEMRIDKAGHQELYLLEELNS